MRLNVMGKVRRVMMREAVAQALSVRVCRGVREGLALKQLLYLHAGDLREEVSGEVGVVLLLWHSIAVGHVRMRRGGLERRQAQP